MFIVQVLLLLCQLSVPDMQLAIIQVQMHPFQLSLICGLYDSKMQMQCWQDCRCFTPLQLQSHCRYALNVWATP